jgi:outer membrane immunogenic protein
MKNTKNILLATVALVVVGAAPAFAADLPARVYTKAPPPMVAPIYNWSGFYVGLNGGGGSTRDCWNNNNILGVAVPSTSEGCHDATGGMVGGQVGYRWQATNWVFGLEAQGDWANFKGSNTSALPVPAFLAPFGVASFTNNSKIDALGLFTGQVGYAWNNVLWYVKGGAAVTDNKYNGNATVPGLGTVSFDSASETRWGGVVGTGLEIGFAPGWSVAFEYDHLFMGSSNNTFGFTSVTAPLLTGTSRIDNIRQDIDMGTVRINYTFGGPVVARY